MNKKLLLALSLFVGFQGLQAQDPVYFTGYGRALVTNDDFQDTLNTQTGKASGGYTLFDLGVYAQSGESLRGGAVLRLRNEFGGFYGDGSAFEFRQMLLEGLIGKIVKYQIGDVDLVQTKYTIYNPEITYTDYESDLFQFRRDIVNYENFYTDDNTWRMQGINAKTTLNFTKGIDKLGIWMYGNRVVDGSLNNGPDRFLYGGALNVSKATSSLDLNLGLNFTSVSDLAGSTASVFEPFKNDVMTTDFDFSFGVVDSVLTIGLKGETGISNTQYTQTTDTTVLEKDDFFFDLGFYATYEPLNLTLSVNYKDVGNDFNSPSAQTRRINDYAAPTTFPAYNSTGGGRDQHIFDRMTQEVGMYNRGISSTLMNYNPIYNNIDPYGAATPNRTGLTIGLALNDDEEAYKLSGEVNMLEEAQAITLEKRKFMGIQGGGFINVLKLLDMEKSLILSAGIRMQGTDAAADSVDLSTTLLDFGLDWEFYTKLHLLVGYKQLTAEGKEFNFVRDEVNNVTTASLLAGVQEYNSSQTVLAAGFRYDFSKKSAFAVQGQFVNYENKLVSNQKYDWTQWFFNYTLQL